MITCFPIFSWVPKEGKMKKFFYAALLAVIVLASIPGRILAQDGLACWQDNAVLGNCTCRGGVWVRGDGSYCGLADQFPEAKKDLESGALIRPNVPLITNEDIVQGAQDVGLAVGGLTIFGVCIGGLWILIKIISWLRSLRN